jgi:hypothetical protein
VAQEAQADGNQQGEEDETKRKAAEQLARGAAAAAQVAENKQREEDETKRKAAAKLALDAAAAAATANLSPAASRKRNAARAAAKKQYIKATADAKKAQAALAKAQATCTKKNKAVALGQQHIKSAEKAKMKADKVHTAAVLQLALLVKGVVDTKSIVTTAVKRKAAGKELETLTMNASIAENDKMNFKTQISKDARTKKGAATGLTNCRSAVVQLRCTMRLLTNRSCFEIVVSLV